MKTEPQLDAGALEACPFCGTHLVRSEFLSNRSREVRTHDEGVECVLSDIRIPMDASDDSTERRAAWNRRASTSHEAVAVRELEWVEDVAETELGSYWVTRGFDGVYRLSHSWARPEERLTKHSTNKAAKAAAQADYESRIRSALRPAPAPAVGWQPIETAPKDGTRIIGGFSKIRWADSHRKHDIVACWWQPEFGAFISSCREMSLAEGLTFEDGTSRQLHSPQIEPITEWMPLPAPSLAALTPGDAT